MPKEIKHKTIICAQCDIEAGYIKDKKLYRGTNPCFNNYCFSCLKDLTKQIDKINNE